MKSRSVSILAAALALWFAGAAMAADTPDSAAAAADNDKELAQAREELRRAAARVAELSRQQGDVARDMQRRVMEVRNRPVIGVLLAPDDQPGVRITGVTPDSAAAKAGLKGGDRLVSVDGTQILGSTGQLRVENARKLLGDLKADTPVRLGYRRDGRDATVSVVPKRSANAFAFSIGDGGAFEWFDADALAQQLDAVRAELDGKLVALERLPGVSSDIEREIARVQREAARIQRSEVPRLLSAFRWNGLNLASVDPQLGRYFGTDKGVLVLSSGDLAGLQAGDVIQRVDGKAVATPREVMDALRDKPDDARVAVDYLRDRKPGKATIAIPRLSWPAAPPAAPAPPAPPAPPKVAFAADGSVVVVHDGRVAYRL